MLLNKKRFTLLRVQYVLMLHKIMDFISKLKGRVELIQLVKLSLK